MMCVRSAGLPPLSFVSEYLGEMYSPARWCDSRHFMTGCFIICARSEIQPQTMLRCILTQV